MDVITISSDSENSVNEDIVVNKASPPLLTDDGCTENYVDRNDEDVRPAIDYNSESKEKKDLHVSNLEIEDFETPAKSQHASILVDLDEEPEQCEYFKYSSLNDLTNSKRTQPVKSMSSSASDSESCSQNSKSPLKKTKQRQKLSQEEKQIVKLAKEQKKLEKAKLREEKKAEQLKQKALKAALFENQRNLKPEENIKFLKVHIDNDIINAPYGGSVISILQQNNIQYEVQSQRKNCTVTWSKKKVEKVIDDLGRVSEKIEIKEENILLYVLNWDSAVELIHRNDLLSHVETVKSIYFDKKLTLVIYGLGKYFSYKKNKQNADFRAEINEKKKARLKGSEKAFEEAHSISGNQLEFALTELQLMGKHNCRLIETPEEFSTLIHNFTKSLSQVDFRLERLKRQNNDVGWVAIDSSAQSVKVDKNGNGLLNLWQRQICQFSAVGLETAQAIVSEYNSPLALLNDYAKCASERDGESLLQNIQIRRNVGIVSSSRRVGPQLSKKIFKFFTADDPDLEL